MQSNGYDNYTDSPAADAAAGPPRRGEAAVARLLGAVATITGAVAAGILALWLIGEFVSDRFFWSQFLEWTPVLAAVGAALAVLIVSTLLHAWANAVRPDDATHARRRVFLRTVWCGLLATAVYATVFDARLLWPRPRGPAPDEDRISFAYWNAAAQDAPGWDTALASLDADVTITVGVNDRGGVNRIADRAAVGLDHAPDALALECFGVVSKRPVLRFASMALDIRAGAGVDPRVPKGFAPRVDPGHAMFMELGPSTSRPGSRPIVVWVIDLPSDLSLTRWHVVAEAAAAIHAARVPVLVAAPEGGWVRDDSGTVGFPAPDVIIGDFNIPRGGRSIRQLTGSMQNAFDQAGRGVMGSWPKSMPVLHLDQTFVGDACRAYRYRLIALGFGDHRAQAVDIVVTK